MTDELTVLMFTAASLGVLHTLLGPDHYLPFVMMSRAQGWSRTKTLLITTVCGLGHIFSSVILGGIGIAFGLALTTMENLESVRGTIAAWGLIAFGGMYCVWGIRHALRHRPHTHWHDHPGGIAHSHEHRHANEHMHAHQQAGKANITPWILFTIFVFGPCEVLIPVLMYPAASRSLGGVIGVTLSFGIATLVTMLAAVSIALWGIERIPGGKWGRFTHATAGAVICLSGVAIQALGL